MARFKQLSTVEIEKTAAHILDLACSPKAALSSRFERIRKDLLRVVFEWNRSVGPFVHSCPELPIHCLQNCSVLPSRFHLLYHMPKSGRVAELGTLHGYFAQKIFSTSNPTELHIIDTNLSLFRWQFSTDVSAKDRVFLHKGDSSSTLLSFPEQYFDWVYIDADHSYEAVRKDLEAAQKRVKLQGYIVLNDYTVWSPLECLPYGVARAVNQFCIKEGWSFRYLALEADGYYDVALCRL